MDDGIIVRKASSRPPPEPGRKGGGSGGARGLFIVLLMMAALIGGVGFYGWKVLSADGAQDDADTAYPVEMTINSADGRELEIELLGRTGTTIHFTRKADGKRFAIELSSIAEEDRGRLEAMPEREPLVKDDAPEAEGND